MRPAVLVVDDNRDWLRVTRSVLEGLGFDVRTAESGEAALRLLEGDFRPAFIMLDFRLDNVMAPEILARLGRSLVGTIPVLVVSQTRWDEDEAAALGAGATVFREKPSRVAALRETILDFWEDHVHGTDASADR